ncbi:unnamed protein product [Hydatigera taeniaeformis]|uniref:RRP15-like protein n=1 Tax=Hydatigena taeniaeformis TaxID=6205 RepID=A0A0R3X991_HYDTA|nr:unnamed protein product [Hydatigera taeniaeformis]
MAFCAIFDVVKKASEEPLPDNKHQILSLAKTDQEKQAKMGAEDVSDLDDLCHPSRSKSERSAWLRYCYKKPTAAAGVRRSANSGCLLIEVSKARRAEMEGEKARERRLKRHATQGVVALFNAVRQHNFVLEKQLDGTSPLIFQREKVVTGFTTSDFLDRLSAGLPGAKAKTAKEVSAVMNLGRWCFSFERSNLSVTDFTLSWFDDGGYAPKLGVNPSNQETKQLISEGDVCPITVTDMPESTDTLTIVKACVRYDIMEQISSIMSDLVAIDLKYSKLAQIDTTQAKEQAQLSTQDPVQIKSGNKETALESLHAYTISELHSQLNSLRGYIRDLDSKFSEVAKCVQERLERLEHSKNELSCEVERLRRFY